MVNKRKYVLGAVAVLILLMVAFSVLKDSPEFRTYTDSYLSIIAGVLLILVGVGYVFYYVNSNKNRMAEREVRQVIRDVNKVQQKAQIQTHIYAATQHTPEPTVKIPSNPGITSAVSAESITEPMDPGTGVANDDRTVMMEDDATMLLTKDEDSTILLDYPTTAVLKVNRNGREEVIPINRPSFYIGRNRQVVHLCESDNKNIGRVHAIIEHDDNTHYIVDLDSLNGTFVNGSKIDGNVRWQLKFGDRLELANIEYIFDRP